VFEGGSETDQVPGLKPLLALIKVVGPRLLVRSLELLVATVMLKKELEMEARIVQPIIAPVLDVWTSKL
jgi:hypothetical protein